MTTLQPQEIVNQRYQLERQLGQNAGRETWLAKDLQKENELVVVKLLAFGGNVQWEDLKLFEREANVLKQLNHPRIPKYRDYFSIDDRSLWFGLVQEYIQGDSLREHIAQGHKFNESQVKKIAIAVLEILIYLHELSPQVLHRDIKPSNLILTGDEGGERNIYLVDFGAVQDKASAEGKSFTVVGTYGYAPMEQYGGRAVAASDLYALGATLIYLLTGISPAELPQDDDARILFSDRTSVKPHFLQWIQTLVEPTVKKRYASARDALKALREPHPIPAPSPVISIKQSLSPSPATFKPYSRPSPPTDTNIMVEQSATQLRVVIPARIWSVIIFCLVAGIVTFWAYPFWTAFLQALYVNSHKLWFYIGTFFILIIFLNIFMIELTTVVLEVGEQETWLTRSLFGKIYWQIKAPTHTFQEIEPVWRMQEQKNRSILDDLNWASAEQNEDNSKKVNVFLRLQGRKYTLATSDLRPTEVNWLMDVIEGFLHKLRRK
jgi:serine/threonine protein kinase